MKSKTQFLIDKEKVSLFLNSPHLFPQAKPIGEMLKCLTHHQIRVLDDQMLDAILNDIKVQVENLIRFALGMPTEDYDIHNNPVEQAIEEFMKQNKL